MYFLNWENCGQRLTCHTENCTWTLAHPGEWSYVGLFCVKSFRHIFANWEKWRKSKFLLYCSCTVGFSSMVSICLGAYVQCTLYALHMDNYQAWHVLLRFRLYHSLTQHRFIKHMSCSRHCAYIDSEEKAQSNRIQRFLSCDSVCWLRRWVLMV